MAKQFTAREKEIYRLGFLNGETQLQVTINNIKATNRHLMDELLRLDFEKPVKGDPNHITITFRVINLKGIIKELGSKIPTISRYHYAALFRRLIKKEEAKQRIAAARIESGLQEALNK